MRKYNNVIFKRLRKASETKDGWDEYYATDRYFEDVQEATMSHEDWVESQNLQMVKYIRDNWKDILKSNQKAIQKLEAKIDKAYDKMTTVQERKELDKINAQVRKWEDEIEGLESQISMGPRGYEAAYANGTWAWKY